MPPTTTFLPPGGLPLDAESDFASDSSSPPSPSLSASSSLTASTGSLSSAASLLSEDSLELDTPATTPNTSAATSNASLPGYSSVSLTATPPSPWLSLSVQPASDGALHLPREVSVPHVGLVPLLTTVSNVANNQAHVSVGHKAPAGSLPTFVLDADQSPSLYLHEARTRVLDRAAQAPGEHYGVRFDKPIDVRVALQEQAMPTAADKGAEASATGAGAGVVGWVRDFCLASLDHALAGRKVQFRSLERSEGQPVQTDGITFEDAEQALASDHYGVSQRLSAAMVTQKERDTYWNRAVRGSSLFVSNQALSLAASFLPHVAQLMEPNLRAAYASSLNSLRNASPHQMPSGETSSDVLQRLHAVSAFVSRVDNGSLDLPSMIPPLAWFGTHTGHKLQLEPSGPLNFSARFASGDEPLFLQAGAKAQLSQPSQSSPALRLHAQARLAASAASLPGDRALLRSSDPAHFARASVDVDASLGSLANLRSSSVLSVQRALVQLSQSLSWSPAFAEAFVKAWLPEMAGELPTLPAATADALKLVGLAALTEAPPAVVARVAAAFAQLKVDVKDVPAHALEALAAGTPVAGRDAAMSSLLMGLPSLRGAIEPLFSDVASDSDLRATAKLRPMNTRLNDTPYKGAVPLSSMLNLEIKRGGDFVIEHAVPAREATVQPAPLHASRAARVGAALVAPFVALASAVALLAQVLARFAVKATGRNPSLVTRPSPTGAEVRFNPYIRIPFAKRLFGDGIPLSWLVHVRLYGAGYASYNKDGTLNANASVGATALDNGTARLIGEVRVLGMRVLRTERLQLLELPLGSDMLNSTLAYWMEPTRPEVTSTQWLTFFDQVFDGIDVRLSPRPLATDEIQSRSAFVPLTHAAAVAKNLTLQRPREPWSFTAQRDLTPGSHSWQWSLQHLGLHAAQLDEGTHQVGARAEVDVSMHGQWHIQPGGSASLDSQVMVLGSLNLFDAQAAADANAEATSTALLHAQWGGNPQGAEGKAKLRWLDGDQAHRQLIDAIGVRPETAAFLPRVLELSLSSEPVTAALADEANEKK